MMQDLVMFVRICRCLPYKTPHNFGPCRLCDAMDSAQMLSEAFSSIRLMLFGSENLSLHVLGMLTCTPGSML